MNKHIINRFVALALSVLCLISCNKPGNGGNDTPPPTPTPPEPTPEITIPSSQDTTPVFTDNGGETSVSFQSSAPWTVDVINTKAVSWCKVSPMSGPAGSAKISIKTDANDTYNERQASVQIKSGSVTKTIVVTQKQQDNITVSTTKFELPSEGGSVKVELKSNIDYKYEIAPACKGWIKYESTKAYESSSLMFAVAANEALDKREGKITVSGGAFSEDVHIYQAGENPTLVLTRNEYDVPAEGGEVNVEVQSNVAVTMSIPSDCTWVYEDKTKSMSSSSFKLAVEANEAQESREVAITFTNADNKLSETVTIRQSGKASVPVSSISLDKESVEMKVAETVTLVATVNPENATDPAVNWSTSDDSVATVADGLITSIKIGKATITAKAGDKTATCVVTVVATPVTSITLDKTSASLKAGETVTLTATVNPSDATDKTVTWITSDASVATVKEGVVTAVKVGTTTITAKAGDKIATCVVTVVATPVTSVTLDKTSASLKAGETVTLTATVNPSDATDKTVAWSTSDASVATVENGVVTAVKVGFATITAKAGDKTATCAVSVVATPVTSVTLDKTSASLKAGETVTLTATVNPSDATDKTVTWSTSDDTVATVKDGVVTAVKVGTATITAKAGDKTATCVVTVVATPVTSVTLDKTSASLKAGETVTLTATVNPSDATDKTVTWSTSDASVATVKDGVVTAVKVGTATITAKAGDKSATCAVTVVATPVTSVTLDKTSASLKACETVTLTATVNPSDATDKAVTWSTSDASVATVSNGVVTAVKVGAATITAKAGDKTATCIVTVVATPVTSVTLDKTSASLKAGETVTLTATVNPSDATDKTVTWSTSDAGVATVNNGVVTAVKIGTASITAKAGDKTATCAVTVVATPVTSVTLDKTSASLKAGETVTLTATVNPSDATDKTVTWSTSDAGVATVNNGVVTAVKVGTATITAKSGDKTATCAITVEAIPVSGVVIDPSSLEMGKGDEYDLMAVVYPENATNKNVTWSTDNPSVVSVNNQGRIVAENPGMATISVITWDGGKTATCTVNVKYIPISSIVFEKSKYELNVGEVIKVKATVLPENASDKTFELFIGDSAKASVSKDREVKALSPGKTRLYARSLDEKVVASCEIVIKGDGMDPSIGDWGNGEGGEGIAD